jgi:hypothetical protein
MRKRIATRRVLKIISKRRSGLEPFNTLRKRWLLTYNISPSGGDKREGAGVENYFFNSLLGPSALEDNSIHKVYG